MLQHSSSRPSVSPNATNPQIVREYVCLQSFDARAQHSVGPTVALYRTIKSKSEDMPK